MTKVLGITAEYNPFHNGHRYHIEAALEQTKADYTIAAMSGDFTQRGEIALMDKWTRAKYAVCNGIDVVFELPFIFACNRARIFAAGGVDLLVHAGATHIAFGCEAGNPQDLWDTAKALHREAAQLEQLAGEIKKEGRSYAKAYEAAVREHVGDGPADLLLHPNNILAVEYMKRIMEWNQKGVSLEAVPILRRGSGYKGWNESEGYAGAGRIRERIRAVQTPEEAEKLCRILRKLMPQAVASNGFSGEAIESLSGEIRLAEQRFFEILRGILIRGEAEEIAGIYCVGEGLEHKFKSEIAKAENLKDLISSLVSKRYTRAAVNRMLTYVALGLKGSDGDRLLGGMARSYLRVLAVSGPGRKYLHFLKKDETKAAEVVTNINRQMPEAGLLRDMIELDGKAADLYNALHGKRLYDYSDRVRTPYIDS